MTTEERRAYLRELGGRGGRATLARHGTEHMARIGKVGFQVTKERYGGEFLAKLLGESYERKFGRRINLTTARNLLAERERAATRRAYPEPTACQSCGGPGQERHHLAGLGAGHGEGLVVWLCAGCHATIHRELRARGMSAREAHERQAS